MSALQNHIGGTWTAASDLTVMDLVNPATEEVIAVIPAGSPADVDAAVAAAVAAQPGWASLTVPERVAHIHRWADAIAADADTIADLECQEMGVPVGLARSFIDGAVAMLKATADEANEYPFESTLDYPDGSSARILRHPLGAVAVITPWNFPVPILLGALGPLLAAGNTVVLKPSERSPLSASRLLELQELPPGVVNLVLGDSRAGAPLSAHPDIKLVHFTGSVAAGRAIATSAGEKLHRVVLELGGKDPVVVDADVDPAQTAAAVAFGAFINTGQICTSMERIYVHRDIADQFTEALVAAAEGFTIGDGRDPQTVLGPLVDERQRLIVDRHVTQAVDSGARVLIGGAAPDRSGFFYPPTVLVDVDETMEIMREETFGPIAPLIVVDSFDEGLRRAAESRFGLAATVYTNSAENIDAAARRIPAGVLWVNKWQGGGPGGVFEPAGESGMGASGANASYDAATRPSVAYIAAAAG